MVIPRQAVPTAALNAPLATLGLAPRHVTLHINTPAPARAMPEGRARPAAENTPPAPAPHLIPGQTGLALALKLINTPALVPVTPVARVLPVAGNIPLVLVRADILGAAEVAPSSHLQAQVAHQVLQEEMIVIAPKQHVMIILYIAELKVGNAVFIDFVIIKIVAMEKLIWDVKLDIQPKLLAIMLYSFFI